MQLTLQGMSFLTGQCAQTVKNSTYDSFLDATSEQNNQQEYCILQVLFSRFLGALFCSFHIATFFDTLDGITVVATRCRIKIHRIRNTIVKKRLHLKNLSP